MIFNSIEYLLFLPLVFGLYWLMRKNLRLQNLFVVVASYVFYGWWDWRFLFLIALTSFLSWGSGLLIDKTDKWKKLYLSGNIVVNLGVLGLFKYFNFFMNSFCRLVGVENSIVIKIILPVGISFYTFQALSYSIDVYRGKIKPTRDIVAFFAYVSFFPQLVAGPIERATNLLPQFEKPRVFDYNQAVEGMRRILWGLFKKMVVADNCAGYVDEIWSQINAGEFVPGSSLALAALLFAFQIYGDFSGYSDIAIGTAKLFGVNLKDNFLTPYFSRNVAEFWKRWHISLNTWFVDYVYIPLGGSRNGKWNTVRNTFFIFLLSGLWHGANWTYVGWGLYHSLLFVPLILMGQTKKYQGVATWKQLPQIILTFALATFGWIIFRAPSIPRAILFLKGMCTAETFRGLYLYFTAAEMWPMNLYIILMLLVEWCGRNNSFCLDNIDTLPVLKNKPIRLTLYVLMFWVIIGLRGGVHTFIYFQF